MADSNSARRPSPRGGRFVGGVKAMRRTLTHDCIGSRASVAASDLPSDSSQIRSPTAGAAAPSDATRGEELEEGPMRALVAGGGMAGLMTALALRESGAFMTID